MFTANSFFIGGNRDRVPGASEVVSRASVSGTTFADIPSWSVSETAPSNLLRAGDAVAVVKSDQPEMAGSVAPAVAGARRVIGFALDAAASGAPVRGAEGAAYAAALRRGGWTQAVS